MIATPQRPRKTPPHSTQSGAGLAAMLCSPLRGLKGAERGGGDNARIPADDSHPPVNAVNGPCIVILAAACLDAGTNIKTDGATAEFSVLTDCFGFGLAGDNAAEATQLLCCFVFHSDTTIPNRLGYARAIFAGVHFSSANDKAD